MLKQCLKHSSQIYIIFAMSFFGLVLMNFFTLYYKQLGFLYHLDDDFMTLMRNISLLIAVIGSTFWGFMIEKVSFYYLYMFNSGLLVGLNLTLPWAIQYKASFGIWLNTIVFLSSAYFPILLTSINRVYGTRVGSDLAGTVRAGVIMGCTLILFPPRIFNAMGLNYA